jgi:phosphatidylinositol-3-phosphatase
VSRLAPLIVVLLALLAAVVGAFALGKNSEAEVGVPITGPADPGATLPRPARVAVLVLENRSYEQVIGSPQAPFLNWLARRYALATRYYALFHPSLPNYVALTGGDSHGIVTNCKSCDTEHHNLLNQLDRARVGWRAYFEGLRGGAGLLGRTARYNPHYNPFGHFERVERDPAARARIGNFANLRHDLARNRLPRFSWIAPDVFHDGHNASLRAADRFAAQLVPEVVRALGPRGVLYLLWDEGPDSDLRGVDGAPGGGRVALIAAGGAARRGVRSSVPANHYALLRTIEANLGVPAMHRASLPSTPLLTGLLRGPAR